MSEAAMTIEPSQQSQSGSFGAMADGVFNFRDLGGPAGSVGTAINPGLVYRADGIHRAGREGRQRLVSASGVRQVIDLRSDRELIADGWFQHGDVIHHHVPIVEDPAFFGRGGNSTDVLRDHYGRMLTENGLAFATALDLIAQALEAHQPILFHCTAGKDRTGTLAALLLAGLGFDDRSVSADYARSADAMPAMLNWYIRNGHQTPLERMQDMGIRPGLADQMMAARVSTMSGMLVDIRKWHGSVGRYLASIGAVDSMLVISRHLLAEPR